MKYAVTIGIVFLLILAFSVFNSFKRRRNLLRYLKSSYGRVPNRKYGEDDMESIASYWNSKKGTVKFSVDDTTWADLDMDSIFKRVNSSCSSVGDEYLYSALHEQTYDAQRLRDLEQAAGYLDKAPADRLKMQYYLAKLGRMPLNGLSDFLEHPETRELAYAFIYPALAALAVLSVVLCVISAVRFLPFLILMMLANIIIYLKTKHGLEAELESLSYVSSLIWCARKLSSLKERELSAYSRRLKKCLSPIRKVGGLASSVLSGSTSDTDLIAQYFKMFFMLDFIVYNHVISTVKKHTAEFKTIYETLGFLDMAACVASYRKSLKYYTVPEFTEDEEIEVDGIVHPLLSKPVPNTVTIRKSSLVTGSNASGKSTFVKALAINAIFAQTLHTCLAKGFRIRPSCVVTSMAVSDSIQAGESYYIAEIKSLKRVLDGLNGQVRCLCLIDEILKGTNTVERIAASAAILSYLSDENCLVIAATHDIELTEMMASLFDNYHFMEQIADDGIRFDYKIREGRSTTKNAIRLLEFLGYDRRIIERANSLAAGFEETGAWDRI